MRSAILLLACLWLGTLPTAFAQTDSGVNDRLNKLETPPTKIVVKSLMHLVEQTLPTPDFAQWSGFDYKPALPGLDDKAVWVGSNLLLKIDDGRVLYVFNSPFGNYEGGPSVHTFDAWLPGPRFYVVSVSCNECHITYLIDARDGKVRDIGAPPILSPNGQIGIVWRPDMESGDVGPFFIDFRSYPPIGIDVPIGPKCGNREPSWLRQTAIWIDDSRVRFEGAARRSQDEGMKQQLRIVDGRAQWEC